MTAAATTGEAGLPAFRSPSTNERIADGIVHGLGVFASLIAITVMIVLAVLWRDPVTAASVVIYGVGTVLVFSLSASYHLTPPSRAKAILRRCDHAAIFIKIAGTCTPLAVVSIWGDQGLVFLAAVWGIAFVGVALKLSGWQGGDRISVALYLAQGWLTVFVIGPMREALETSELVLCIAGGLIYTAGCAVYLAPRLPFGTAIWHMFVLVASACFYAAILMAVVLR